MNKEYTVPELKRLLERAEAEIDVQKCKVRALESIITKLGGEVPKEDEIARLAEEYKEADEESASTAEERMP